MDIHVKTLGLLNILFGVFGLLLSLTVFAFYGGPMSIYSSVDDTVVGALLATTAVFHVLLAIPCIVGGFYLRSFAEWARGVLIVTSALNILNIPIGSVIGGYGLWVLLTEETDPLFSNPPPNPGAKKPAQTAIRSSSRKDTPPGAPLKKSAVTTIVPSPRS
jgi:hypothetical protein